MRISATIVLALGAAACGGQPVNQAAKQEPANQTANQAESAQSYQQRILDLPEPQRLAVFLRAIRDAGQDCQEVTDAAGAGTYQGRPVWQARCRGGGEWTIVLTDGGIAQVLNANEATLVTDAPAGNATGQ